MRLITCDFSGMTIYFLSFFASQLGVCILINSPCAARRCLVTQLALTRFDFIKLSSCALTITIIEPTKAIESASTASALNLRSLSARATISIPLSIRFRNTVRAFLTFSRERRSNDSTIKTVPDGIKPCSTCLNNPPSADVGSRLAPLNADTPASRSLYFSVSV